MKKTSRIVLFSLSFLILLVTAKPIHALTVIINDNGSMTVTQGQVLGEETEDITEDEKMEKKVEVKVEKREVKQELRNVRATEEKQLRIKNENKKTDVLIEKKIKNERKDVRKDEKKEELKEERIVDQEKIESSEVKIEVPAQLKERKVNLENSGENKENREIKKIKEERQERKDKLEITIETDAEGKQATEFKAGEVKARLQAAEFVVDPTTNEVTITTPSGQVHVLKHLPDQALERMKNAGLIDSENPSESEELTVETEEDGSVVYKTNVTEKRQLFGLIPFEYKKEVKLEDDDSTVTEEPAGNKFWGNLLLRLSR